jgi:hypothetical protein
MGRTAEAKPYVPPQTAPAPATGPVSPHGAAGVTELYLVWHFGFSLVLEWRFLADPVGTLELMIDIGAPALSRTGRLATAEALTAAIDGDADDGSPPNPALLMARSHCFCRLRLTTDEDRSSSRRG